MGCDLATVVQVTAAEISTHTSLVGCDGTTINIPNKQKFLLTHPLWDVTLYIVYYSLSIPIYHEMDL